MKTIAPVRMALGVRTIFNILGPLANPAQPAFHVIGAFSESMAELMAHTLSGMNAERSLVIHGAPGWDEPTPVGPFLCFDVRPGSVERTVRDPADYGLSRCSAEDLEGGEPEENAVRLRDALCGGDTLAHREALILGAALALEVTGEVTNPQSGVTRAREILNDGVGAQFVKQLESVGIGLA
jgi:anthranilate phosphoribosyltransferase